MMNKMAISALLAAVLAIPLAAAEADRTIATTQAESAELQPGAAAGRASGTQNGTLYSGDGLRARLSIDMEKMLELALQRELGGESMPDADSSLLYVSAN